MSEIPQDELLVRYLEGAASSEEVAKVEKLLHRDQSVADRLVQLSEIELSLHETGGVEAPSNQEVVVDAVSAIDHWQEVDSRRQERRRNIWVVAASVVLVSLVAASFWIKGTRPDLPPGLPDAGYVIVDQDDTITVDGELFSRDAVSVGGKGVLRIANPTGSVQLIIDSPSRFKIESEMRPSEGGFEGEGMGSKGAGSDTSSFVKLMRGSLLAAVGVGGNQASAEAKIATSLIEATTKGGTFRIESGGVRSAVGVRAGTVDVVRRPYLSVARAEAGELCFVRPKGVLRVVPLAFGGDGSPIDEAAPLFGRWRMNGSVSKDEWIPSGPLFSEDGKLGYTQGKIAQGLLFGGGGGLLGSETSMPPKFAFECWLWADKGKSGYYHPVFTNSGGGFEQDGFRIVVGNESRAGAASLWLETGNGADGMSARTGEGSFPLGRWNHVLVLVDRLEGKAQVWINGRNATKGRGGTAPVRKDFNVAGPVFVGVFGEGGESLFGRIDEMAIYRGGFEL